MGEVQANRVLRHQASQHAAHRDASVSVMHACMLVVTHGVLLRKWETPDCVDEHIGWMCGTPGCVDHGTYICCKRMDDQRRIAVQHPK